MVSRTRSQMAHKTLGERDGDGDDPSFRPAEAVAQSSLVSNVDPSVYPSPTVPTSWVGMVSTVSSELRVEDIVGLGLKDELQEQWSRCVSPPARSSSPALSVRKHSRSSTVSGETVSEETIRRLWEQFLIWVIYAVVCHTYVKMWRVALTFARCAGRAASYCCRGSHRLPSVAVQPPQERRIRACRDAPGVFPSLRRLGLDGRTG